MPRAPRLEVLRELVPLGIIDRGALVGDLLLGRLQTWKVLAGHVHLDGALDLLRTGMLFDDIDLERLLL